jgi:hypothetical protein
MQVPITVPILGVQPSAPKFVLRLFRNERFSTVEVLREGSDEVIAQVPFTNELWDQLFHSHVPQPVEPVEAGEGMEAVVRKAFEDHLAAEVTPDGDPEA